MKLPSNETGADFWRDAVNHHGLEEALGICGRYLREQIKTENHDERQFCRKLFAEMYEATAGKTDPRKRVYPYSFTETNERLETSYYHESRRRNDECAKAIDDVIHASCYRVNYFNLESAAMIAVNEFGFARVNAVLAYNLQQHEYDGRYSASNKQWAKGFDVPKAAFKQAYMNAHPILIEDFTNYVRKFYDELGAERFVLPGQDEIGEKSN